MRENRTSGSEGGEAQTNELSLPLSPATPGGPSTMSVRIIDSKAALTGLSMIFVW